MAGASLIVAGASLAACACKSIAAGANLTAGASLQPVLVYSRC